MYTVNSTFYDIIQMKGADKMPLSEARKKANQKYNAKTYDMISFRVTKGKKEKIQEHAASMGESFNRFINRSINEAIARDKEKVNK